MGLVGDTESPVGLGMDGAVGDASLLERTLDRGHDAQLTADVDRTLVLGQLERPETGEEAGGVIAGSLGCICRTYERNLYGDMADNLNAGLPTDRFEVECWLDKRCPQFEPGGATREIEIPTDFQSVKRSDLRQALAWRAHTRAQFEQAFADGFAVRAFTNRSDRAWYTLTRLSANLAII